MNEKTLKAVEKALEMTQQAVKRNTAMVSGLGEKNDSLWSALLILQTDVHVLKGLVRQWGLLMGVKEAERHPCPHDCGCDKNPAYLRGVGEGDHAAGARQKQKVLEAVENAQTFKLHP